MCGMSVCVHACVWATNGNGVLWEKLEVGGIIARWKRITHRKLCVYTHMAHRLITSVPNDVRAHVVVRISRPLRQ